MANTSASPPRREELAAELDAFDEFLGGNFDADATLASAEAIEQEASALDDVELVQRARLVQVDMWDRKGKIEVGIRILWEVNAWATEHGHRPLLARTHLLLAKIHQHLGDMASGLDHVVRSVELLDPTTPARTRTVHVLKLADALDWNGSYDAARERYRQAEELAEVTGDVVRQLSVLNSLAYSETKSGNLERASAAIDRMVAVSDAHGVPLSPNWIDTIARVQIALGRFAEAERTIKGGIQEFQALGLDEADALPEYLLTLAVAQRHLGAADRALDNLDRSLALCDERGLAELRTRVQQERAEVYAASGDFQHAFELHKAFHAEAEALRSRQREAQARARHAIYETAEARENAELFREQARRDPLTGLPNRRFVDEQLPDLIASSVQARAPLTVALLDLDHFKRINDTLSHDVGDQVLATVAGLLAAALATIAEAAFAARIGGEEFLVVLPGVASADAACHLEALRTAIDRHSWEPLTGALPVTVSIGGTTVDAGDNPSQATLLRAADRNLYAAKCAGRNRVVTDRRVSEPDFRGSRA